MKVVGGCSLDNRTIMKDFYFEDDVSEREIQDKIDMWAESLFHSWYVICKSDGEEKYGE